MVRMTSGVDAGEVKNMPYLAASGAIRNGLAVELGATEPLLSLPPAADITAGIVPAASSEPVDDVIARAAHHKRPGRRR